MKEEFKRNGAQQKIEPEYVKMVCGISEDLLGKYDDNEELMPMPIPVPKPPDLP